MCQLCEGLHNPADNDLATLDSNEIGPWSRLHGDLNAKIMVVDQDWGTTDYFIKNIGLDNLKNPTTQTLEKLLKVAGINVSLTTYNQPPRGLFLINAILCLKDSTMQSKVADTWFKNCGPRFLRPQIEIVSPRVVIALGQKSGLGHRFGHPPTQPYAVGKAVLVVEGASVPVAPAGVPCPAVRQREATAFVRKSVQRPWSRRDAEYNNCVQR